METTPTSAPELVSGLNLYEVGYLLSPLVTPETVVDTIATGIKKAIQEAGGNIVFEVAPKMTNLAYAVAQMIDNRRTRYREAYFGALYFETEAGSLPGLQAALAKDKLILRHLIMKTTKEAFRAPARRSEGRRAPTSVTTDGSKPELTKEEIDKEIEGLLTPATA